MSIVQYCPLCPIMSICNFFVYFVQFCPFCFICPAFHVVQVCPFCPFFFSYFVQYIFPSCFSFSELFTCNIQRLRQDSQRCFISACNPLHSSLLWPLLLRGQDHFQGSGWVHGYRTIHATSQYQQIARMGQVVLWVSRRWWQRILWQWHRNSKFKLEQQSGFLKLMIIVGVRTHLHYGRCHRLWSQLDRRLVLLYQKRTPFRHRFQWHACPIISHRRLTNSGRNHRRQFRPRTFPLWYRGWNARNPQQNT